MFFRNNMSATARNRCKNTRRFHKNHIPRNSRCKPSGRFPDSNEYPRPVHLLCHTHNMHRRLLCLYQLHPFARSICRFFLCAFVKQKFLVVEKKKIF